MPPKFLSKCSSELQRVVFGFVFVFIKLPSQHFHLNFFRFLNFNMFKTKFLSLPQDPVPLQEFLFLLLSTAIIQLHKSNTEKSPVTLILVL